MNSKSSHMMTASLLWEGAESDRKMHGTKPLYSQSLHGMAVIQALNPI